MDTIRSRERLRLGETNNSVMIDAIMEQDSICLSIISFRFPGVRFTY